MLCPFLWLQGWEAMPFYEACWLVLEEQKYPVASHLPAWQGPVLLCHLKLFWVGDYFFCVILAHH